MSDANFVLALNQSPISVQCGNEIPRFSFTDRWKWKDEVGKWRARPGDVIHLREGNGGSTLASVYRALKVGSSSLKCDFPWDPDRVRVVGPLAHGSEPYLPFVVVCRQDHGGRSFAYLFSASSGFFWIELDVMYDD